MARSAFGGGYEDWLFTRQGNLLALKTGTTTLTFWSAPTGGTQYTDLLDTNNAPITQVVVNGYQIPDFYGPDGILAMYAQPSQAGSTRFKMQARDLTAVAAAVAALGNLYVSGVDGNGTTDNSTAFAAAYSAAAAGGVTPAVLGGSRRGTKTISLPAGTFVTATPEALMSDLGISATRGLVVRGAGRDMTNIVFSPTTANQYLLNNNDDWMHLTFEDLTFHSTVSTASFMKSTANSSAQNYVFNRVNWSGTWKYGIDLQGTNLNSEMSWAHCGIYGNWTAFLYSASGSSTDEFLNYNFSGCNVEYATGNFIDLYSGGSINVFGGSLIHTGTSASAQTFFKFSNPDQDANASRLLVQGVRVEHRHSASKLIDSQWKRGHITFISVDTGTKQLDVGANTWITATFTGVDNDMATVEFIDCDLMGKHSYQFESLSHERSRRVVYRGCEICNFDSAHDFLTIVNSGSTTNLGSTIPIVFEHCRGNLTGAGQSLYPFDCTVNWQLALNATPKRYQVSLKKPLGGLPVQTDTAAEVWLPLNAVVTGVRFYMPAAGSSTSTTWAYTLATSEGSPTTIAIGSNPTQWQLGFNISVDTWFMCDSDAKRHLTLAAANITQQSASALCVVTYLA